MTQGLQILSNSEELVQCYVALSRSLGENTRTKFASSLDSIVDKKGTTKPYATIVTLVSCIGDPTLAKSHNLKGSHPVLSGLPDFAKWFYTLLNLPFE